MPVRVVLLPLHIAAAPTLMPIFGNGLTVIAAVPEAVFEHAVELASCTPTKLNTNGPALEPLLNYRK